MKKHENTWNKHEKNKLPTPSRAMLSRMRTGTCWVIFCWTDWFGGSKSKPINSCVREKQKQSFPRPVCGFRKLDCERLARLFRPLCHVINFVFSCVPCSYTETSTVFLKSFPTVSLCFHHVSLKFMIFIPQRGPIVKHPLFTTPFLVPGLHGDALVAPCVAGHDACSQSNRKDPRGNRPRLGFQGRGERENVLI